MPNIRERLPLFATQELTHQQLLDFHIRNKTAHANIQEYQRLLEEVGGEVRCSLQAYDSKLKEGEQTMGELVDHLSQSCLHLASQRQALNVTVERVHKSYAGIAPKLRKINSIKRVL